MAASTQCQATKQDTILQATKQDTGDANAPWQVVDAVPVVAAADLQGMNFKPVWMCEVDGKWGQKHWAQYPDNVAQCLEAAYKAAPNDPVEGTVEWTWESPSRSQTVPGSEHQDKKARRSITYVIKVGDNWMDCCNGVQECTRGSKITRRGVVRFLTKQ